MALCEMAGQITGEYGGKRIVIIVILKKVIQPMWLSGKLLKNEIKIVEIKYAGTHERVDYSRVC